MKKSVLLIHLRNQIRNLTKNDTYVFRLRSYNIVVKKIMAIASDQITEEVIDSLDLTDGMKYKLNELIKIKKVPVQPLEDELQSVIGIGKKLALDLVKLGVSSLSDLKKKKYYEMLPLAAQIDIRYKPIRPIPRYMIVYFEDVLKTIKSIRFPFVIVGSYRRGAPSSSDIDVLVREDFVNKLDTHTLISTINQDVKRFITIYPPYATGPQKISTIVRLNKYRTNVKVDFFISPKEELPFAILYSTGSKEFNIKMRQLAKKKGYLLNQKGISKSGVLIDPSKFKREHDIFRFLGMDYLSPTQRN
jgi:DNA polymerase/3'-5' exonuclease PolX